jgi:hypothetical protein
MSSVNSKPASDLVLFLDHGMHLTAQIWKRSSKQTDEVFEWLASTDRPTGAGPKELDVVRQNLVRYFESSLAHYLVCIELNERLALLLNNPILLSRRDMLAANGCSGLSLELQRAGEKLLRAVPHLPYGTVRPLAGGLILRRLLDHSIAFAVPSILRGRSQAVKSRVEFPLSFRKRRPGLMDSRLDCAVA